MIESEGVRGSETRSPVFIALVLLIAVAAAWAVLVVPYLPTNDGPQHIMSGYMQNHFREPNTVYRDLLVPQSQFAERGFAMLFMPLENMFGWRRATQMFLVVTVELTGFASIFFASGVHPARRPLGLLGFALAFTWPLYMGFFAFALTSVVGLFTLGTELRRRDGAWRPMLVVGVLLAVQSFMHVIAAALTGLALAALCVTRMTSTRRRRLRDLAWLGAVGALPALVLVAAASGHSDVQFDDLPLRWPTVAERLATLSRLCVPGNLSRAAIAFALVVGAYAWAAVRAFGGGLTRNESGVLVLGGAFLVLGTVSPIDIPGWQHFGSRWLVVPVLVSTSLVPLERVGRRWRVAAIGGISALCAASLAASAHFHRRLWRDCFPNFGPLANEVSGARFELPIVLGGACGVSENPAASEVPYLDPLVHAGALFAANHGAYQPYLFLGSSSTYAFRSRDGNAGGVRVPPHPGRDLFGVGSSPQYREDRAFHREVLTGFSAFGRAFDRIVVIGAGPPDTDAFVGFGYVPEVRTERLLMARFRGCTAHARLPAASGRIRVEYGADGLRVPLGRQETSGAVAVDVVLSNLLCGKGWIRIVTIRPDRDGRAQELPLCGGADATGMMSVEMADGAVFTCEPPETDRAPW